MTLASLTRGAAIDAAIEFSRYARRVAERRPTLAGTLDTTRPFTPAAMQAFIAAADADDEAAFAHALRDLRQQVMLVLMSRDLTGTADLAEVTGTVSALADIAIEETCRRLEASMERQYGTPTGQEGGQPQRLMVIGMGKLGGRELNVSSDIDLVFLYGEEGETSGPRRVSNFEYFTRLARKLVAALGELTADGFVFRMDIRLRPYGDSGPLVCNLAMLENYFVTQGREWERYAWIKARLVRGGHEPELTGLVRPFVFRRHLDYGAFDSMRDLHAQVRKEVSRRDMAENIKLGPGGIREIEFIAQVFQLIRGGREAQLRVQPTLEVLAILGARGLLPMAAVDELARAYDYLRRLEHRLQYLDDQQTQDLPQSADERERIARSMGCRDWPTFVVELNAHRCAVSSHFEQIFAASGQSRETSAGSPAATLEQGADLLARQLSASGYRDAAALAARVIGMRTGSRYRQMPASGQAKIDLLLPRMLDAAARHENPDATAESLFALIDSIGRRESYLSLLIEYPNCLGAVANLTAASRWAAEYLGRHPILLDELLDNRALHAPLDWAALGRALDVQLDEHAGDVERQMDALRHFKHTQTFRLLAQDLAGELRLETLSDHLSDLACTCLRSVMRLVWAQLRTRHLDAPRFAIIGYGKLGGKELGYASDLDIIFLYDDAAPDAAEIYARYALRVNSWLSTVSSAGELYQTDLRLRPDGASGLLVSPVEAYESYQRSKAWVWEHQALTRARYVAGDAAIGTRFERLRCEILCQEHSAPELRSAITTMREKMLAAHPNTSALFDIKHDRGGIIDVEFIVQYLVLAYARAHPALTGNIGNLALLKLAATLGLIPSDEAESVHAAYREYRRLQHALRLRGEAYARVERESLAREIAAVSALWSRVFGGQRVSSFDALMRPSRR